MFDKLNAQDGKHPSELGSYLAASVIYCTIAGADTSGKIYEKPGIDKEIAIKLDQIANERCLIFQ